VSASSFFRILVEPKGNTDKFVARCLDTGFVSVGKSYESAAEQMLDILRTEIVHALKTNNVSSLFRPVPQNLQQRWEELTREYPPKTVSIFPEGGQYASVAEAPRAA
jgi:hypothetical protein